jgi:hypothetical protein
MSFEGAMRPWLMIGLTVQPFYLPSQFKIVFYHQRVIRISNKIFRTSKANAKRENMVHNLISVIFAYNIISNFFIEKPIWKF